jgi:hypothetical protein
MKEGQNYNYEKKGVYKTAKNPPFKKKEKKRKEKKRKEKK